MLEQAYDEYFEGLAEGAEVLSYEEFVDSLK